MNLPARLGKYELVAFLGGGMSHVYRAKDTVIGRTVAVKILTPEGCADPDVKDRFLAEARMAGNISHENIISVYDFGEANGQPFLVMEFLEGEDLRTLIRTGRIGDLKEKLRLCLQVARALDYIHSQKIVHRDVKPDNIHINSKGVVKLIDFGIAKVEGQSRTRAGFVLGTPYYMAPEQVRGETVTPLVDVYAFGILLFELMTGAKPFKADTVERIFQCILNEPLDLTPLRHAKLSPELCDLITHCVAKNPGERPRNFGEIANALEWMIQQESVPAPAPVAPVAPSSGDGFVPSGRWRIPALVAALVLALVAGFAVWRLQRLSAAPALAATIQTPTGAMILIPAGEFLSGKEKRRVHVRDYYIDKTEVTNADYEKYSQARARPLPDDFRKDRPGYPVTNITIDDARDYARWAQKRLPTPLEWEKAARGTDGRLFPWGDEENPADANVAGAGPWPADKFERDVSPWGVENMAGNVTEFVDQVRNPSAEAVSRFAKLLNPPPTGEEPWYMVRGGSFKTKLASGVTFEWGTVPARYRASSLGFRCVRLIERGAS